MRKTCLLLLITVFSSGCLDKVEPISNFAESATTHPGSVTLQWQPPTENVDGTPLTNLAGYRIYVGTESRTYTHREIELDNPGLTTYVIENLSPGTYYVAATALNSAGVQSFFSDELAVTVNP